jgi:hypothetical protein
MRFRGVDPRAGTTAASSGGKKKHVELTYGRVSWAEGHPCICMMGGLDRGGRSAGLFSSSFDDGQMLMPVHEVSM